MHRLFMTVFLLWPMTVGYAAAPAFPAATVAKQMSVFLAPGWSADKQASGDLNKDGRADQALVADGPTESDRTLLLGFARPDGQWQLAARAFKPVLPADAGGMLGDPLQSIAIDRGVLTIVHYGGSRDRWGCTDRFRYQDGEFFQIGHAVVHQDTIELTAREVDTNLLTGQQIETNTTKGRERVTKRKAPIVPLKNLERYQPCGE